LDITLYGRLLVVAETIEDCCGPGLNLSALHGAEYTL
jgi:hypothetical protein